MEKKIKFHKFFVTDGTTKARVFYSPSNAYGKESRKAVTLYERGYDRNLPKVFGKVWTAEIGFDCPEYKNETDIQSDYHDEGHVTLYEDHPLYQEALTMAEGIKKQREEKREARYALRLVTGTRPI